MNRGINSTKKTDTTDIPEQSIATGINSAFAMDGSSMDRFTKACRRGASFEDALAKSGATGTQALADAIGTAGCAEALTEFAKLARMYEATFSALADRGRGRVTEQQAAFWEAARFILENLSGLMRAGDHRRVGELAAAVLGAVSEHRAECGGRREGIRRRGAAGNGRKTSQRGRSGAYDDSREPTHAWA
jgi:hypothetical protein